MADNLDILIRFLVDQAAAGNSVRAIESLERQFNEFEKAVKQTKAEIAEIREMSVRLGAVSRGIFLAGTAITGGIFGLAAKYVKDAKEATEGTERWRAAQEKLSKAGSRAGAVMAETALPLLEKAARLAEKAAAFVEKNPDIIRAAMNTGMVVAGLGAVGMAVSKGIRLYTSAWEIAVRIKEAQGYRIFATAVDKFLVGTAQFSGASATRGAAGGAGGIATLGKYLLTGIGALLAGAWIGDKIGFAISKAINPEAKKWEAKDYLTEIKQVLAITAFRYGEIFGNQEKGLKWFKAVRDALGLAEKDAEDAAFSIKVMSAEAKKAFSDWRAADAGIVADTAQKRNKIMAETEALEKAARTGYRLTLQEINRSAAAARTEAMNNYAKETQRAELNYAKDRAEIIKGGSEAIQRIERDHQENMRKMAEDHSNRVADLVASRDALGLLKENRRFEAERAEAERGVNQAIAQEKQETAARLTEIAARYQEERKEREEQYQERLREIARQASEQRRQAREAHAREMADLRNARIQQLKDLQEFLNREREAKRQQYIAILRDLGSAIPNSMQVQSSSSTTTTSTAYGTNTPYSEKINTNYNPYDVRYRRAGGGYAHYGMYLLGDTAGGGRGTPEFVMSGNTTRAAERALGGNVTQEKLLSALAFAGSNGQSVNYTDNRRMPSQGPIDREALRKDMLSLLRQELWNAFKR